VSGIRKPSERPPGFTYSRPGLRGSAGRILRCDQISLNRLVQRFGTPLYVYSAGMIRERLRRFERTFRKAPHTVCFSVKANSNLSILRLLAREGCGFDVVSGGELERVLRVSRGKAKNVVFSGVGKTREEMRFALQADILLFNVESESELLSLAECAAKARKIARIALRVNPDVPAKTHPYISTGLRQHKFGVPIREAGRLYAKAAQMKSLRVSGVSVHIGSQISDVKPFAAAMERVAELVRELRADGHRIEFVDAGGGLGIDYQREGALDFAKQLTGYADAVLRPLRGLRVHLLLEPGRCIVGPAGVLLTRVIYKKTNGKKKFVIADAAMNDLLRPALYGAYHQIVPVQSSDIQAYETVDVVGPVCETGDFLARDRKMPVVQEGDPLAILDAGAYGMVLASNYNTRPRPAEVLVDGRSVKLIRRRETVADLLRCET
jgi:diaminopimelate decarboxylase